MIDCQHHRGPDAAGVYVSPNGIAGLANNRLSIIDLSENGRQPLSDPEGRFWIVLNGEIYNYRELRRQLESQYRFKTLTDTEVLLAAYIHWGEACLDKLIGMFSFVIWDDATQTSFAARDRFGVKPFYYSQFPSGDLAIASEIKALHAIGIPREPDEVMWATYLTFGLYDHSERTFWKDIRSLPPGHALRWQRNGFEIRKWYDLAEQTGAAFDTRAEDEVLDEYRALLKDSVRLRFRSDVPVGINLSGGLDSSILLGLVHSVQGPDSQVSAFTFVTGDEQYDELCSVRQMLARTQHPHHVCGLNSAEVPDLALKVQSHQDEPFGGLPTLAYSKVFERARELGVIVLLDGQGQDEQWAGYDYYARLNGTHADARLPTSGPVQGSHARATRPECLIPEFRALAEPFYSPSLFSDELRNIQYRDARYTKIPRALRFNDRISMMHSIELREPFLDHRLFELALRQPEDRKIRNGIQKYLLRQIALEMVPSALVGHTKRAVQTPQREWLKGPLKNWVEGCLELIERDYGGLWMSPAMLRSEWQAFQQGTSDNSFCVWQWISLALWRAPKSRSLPVRNAG
jgi:asparagine synthase (glutamine-hydrolysing)